MRSTHAPGLSAAMVSAIAGAAWDDRTTVDALARMGFDKVWRRRVNEAERNGRAAFIKNDKHSHSY
jgi:hypothetical protein